MKNPEFVASAILTVATAFVIAIWVPGRGQEKIGLAVAYGGLVLLFLFGFMILAGIASGKIDISQILAEKGIQHVGFSTDDFYLRDWAKFLSYCGQHGEISGEDSHRSADSAGHQRHYIR